MAEGDYFVDCHCHILNVEDIPLYATLARLVDTSRLKLAIGAIIVGASVNVKKVLAARQKQIGFFERTREKKLVDFSRGVAAARRHVGKTKTILTPLIMDFEMIRGSHRSCAAQMHGVRAAILNTAARGPGASAVASDTLVFPFLGVDLRRFDDATRRSQVDAILASLAAPMGGMRRGLPQALATGDVIGIKLYPTIDGGPTPPPARGREATAGRMLFFEMCADRQLPITVHSQKHSYAPFDAPRDAWRLGEPRRWARVLERHPTLRVNFAHFGGDESVIAMMRLRLQQPMLKAFRKTWTWGLVSLLKRYPNTYADLSAFDFASSRSVRALRQLLVLEECGALDKAFERDAARYKLADKLLWGSDLPMVPSAVSDYARMFQAFAAALDLPACLPIRQRRHDGSYERVRLTRDRPLPSPASLLNRFVSTNPYRFLFG